MEEIMENKKTVIGRRFYPVYYGKPNTQCSYRSYYVGDTVRKGSADFVAGTCDASVPDGWVPGVHGNPARKRTALDVLAGFVRA
jgi:hypothetical protein